MIVLSIVGVVLVLAGGVSTRKKIEESCPKAMELFQVPPLWQFCSDMF
jgi:hypothetical protein